VMRAVCDRVIHWGLLLLLVFTPLAFGTVETWSIALMEWGIVTLVLVFLLSRLWPSGETRHDASPRGGRPLGGMELSIGLFLLLIASQLVPLPLAWLRVISPGSARMYGSVDLKSWDRAPAAAPDAAKGAEDPLLRLEERPRRPISVNPERTRGKVVQLGALIALFFMVAHWADGARATSILRAVVVVGFLVAVFGLVQLLTWNGRIFWMRSVPNGAGTMPRAFGPFVNHNHFAGYIEMIIPLALSFAFWLVDKRRAAPIQARPGGGDEGLSGALRSVPERERGRLSQWTLATFAAVILIVSLFFSLSRGGILSACISGSIMLILLGRRSASRWIRMSIVLAIPVVVVAMIALIGSQDVKKQLGTYATCRVSRPFDCGSSSGGAWFASFRRTPGPAPDWEASRTASRPCHRPDRPAAGIGPTMTISSCSGRQESRAGCCSFSGPGPSSGSSGGLRCVRLTGPRTCSGSAWP